MADSRPVTLHKTLYLIRHGESEYNVWRKSVMFKPHRWLDDPMLFDAALSERGEVQVVELRHKVNRLKLDADVQLVKLLIYPSCHPGSYLSLLRSSN